MLSLRLLSYAVANKLVSYLNSKAFPVSLLANLVFFVMVIVCLLVISLCIFLCYLGRVSRFVLAVLRAVTALLWLFLMTMVEIMTMWLVIVSVLSVFNFSLFMNLFDRRCFLIFFNDVSGLDILSLQFWFWLCLIMIILVLISLFFMAFFRFGLNLDKLSGVCFALWKSGYYENLEMSYSQSCISLSLCLIPELQTVFPTGIRRTPLFGSFLHLLFLIFSSNMLARADPLKLSFIFLRRNLQSLIFSCSLRANSSHKIIIILNILNTYL